MKKNITQFPKVFSFTKLHLIFLSEKIQYQLQLMKLLMKYMLVMKIIYHQNVNLNQKKIY
jgi:hypothetical protein